MPRTAQTQARPPLDAILDRLFRPIDAASLIVVRVAFGLLMAGVVVQLFISGDFHRLYLAQTIRFKYPFFGWIPDPSPMALQAVFVIVAVSALMMAIGLLYRWAAVMFFLSWSYTFLVDQTPYQNHNYLICLLGFIVIFMPLNRTFSVDARLRPQTRCDTAPAWCLYILRFQIAVVYIFGGIRKINPDWLRGEPIRSMLHMEAFEHPIVGEWFFSETLVMTFAYGGLLLDLLIVPALLWRVTRIPAFCVAVAFHLTNAWLWDIDMFPWFMIAATLTFFPPDYPRRVARLLRSDASPSEASIPAPAPCTRRHKAIALMLSVYAVIQILIPCRPFLYPGHPLVQQDLLVFSWNMMLRVNTTQLRFVVVDNDTGEKWEVNPDMVLSDFQLSRLSAPDLMHQTAKRLAEEYGAKERTRVSVYIRARHSIHGRPWQVAYDPDIDFAATPRTIGPKPWVMPFLEPYPPDPATRTAFYREEWRFCKSEGILPLNKEGADPETIARVKAWEKNYREVNGLDDRGY